LYHEDEYGSHILTVLDRARRFNLWMGETLRPYVGDRVLEIGAGIGNLTNQFIPRDLYVASDINPHYLHYLRSYSFGKPYLRVMEIDAGNSRHFCGLEQQFDTVLMLNVLEHVPDELKALHHLWSALEPGGRAIILVPQHPALYGTLDAALEHRERYTEAGLRRALTAAGFRIETVFDFNRFSVPGWWLHGKILQRKKFSGYPRKAGRFGIGRVLYGAKFNHEFSPPAEDRPIWDFGRKAAYFSTPFGLTPKRAFAKSPVKPGCPRAVCLGWGRRWPAAITSPSRGVGKPQTVTGGSSACWARSSLSLVSSAGWARKR
jgi:SAM-dependent methyltransferase